MKPLETLAIYKEFEDKKYFSFVIHFLKLLILNYFCIEVF